MARDWRPAGRLAPAGSPGCGAPARRVSSRAPPPRGGGGPGSHPAGPRAPPPAASAAARAHTERRRRDARRSDRCERRRAASTFARRDRSRATARPPAHRHHRAVSRRFAVSSNNGQGTPSPARTLGARLSIGREARSAARLVAGGLVLLFAFTVLYVAAFHAPRAKVLDVGVVGSAPVAATVQSRLDSADRGAFDVRAFGTERDARQALLDTDVHGVIVPGAGRDRILVAQALGVAQTDTVVAAL